MGAPGHLPPWGRYWQKGEASPPQEKKPHRPGRAPTGASRHLPHGEATAARRVRKREALGGFSLAKSPQTPQMRLKHGAFRHLRMAAKGAALGSRHLLEKVDENFWNAPQAKARAALPKTFGMG